jgi:UDP-N-acetylmuramoylalanine--D-glutamate ligase
VVTGDNPRVTDMIRGVAGQVYQFSTERTDVDAWFERTTGMLHVLGAPLVKRERLQLAGDHNVANALAALLAVMVADRSHKHAGHAPEVGRGDRDVQGAPEPLEPVAESNGVLWLNDSKATNVASTQVAIAGMTRPTIVCCSADGTKVSRTRRSFRNWREWQKAVLAYGESGPLITADLEAPLRGRVPVEHMRDATFTQVVSRARQPQHAW